MWLSPFIVRARPCFQDGVFRVPKNGMLETNKPLAMRVVGNATSRGGIHMDINSLAHTKWNCKYHIVICTKVSQKTNIWTVKT